MGLIVLRKTLYETLGITRMNNVSMDYVRRKK